MPRLRDTRTGVVVDVDDATADLLGTAYEPAEQAKAPPKRTAAKKTAAPSETR